MPFGINKKTGRPGPAPAAARDGDKVQARYHVNLEVRSGRLANPNDLPCHDCGHLGADRRHEYDHHLGYAAEHHLDVQAVCTTCHAKRDGKASQTHCIHGHEFTPENTIIKGNGNRQCRQCSRDRDRKRRGAAYWREYRAKKRKEG